MTRKILYLVLLLLAQMIISPFAYAHSVKLLRSDPPDGAHLDSSPTVIRAWFNEELDASSTMRVLDSTGGQVDNGDGGLDLTDPDHASMKVTVPVLIDGVYTVSWRAVLVDGDVTTGVFHFTVGTPPATTSLTQSMQAEDETAVSLPVLLAIGGSILILIAGLWQWQSSRNQK
ncbi:MAG: copper resistance protein CopC [Chloroflexi bacterium]|nr:MAG: copper resistance protein CopC [Chloroflexota bacterium]